MRRPWVVLAPLVLLLSSGCVERVIQVRSDPPDATVLLDDQLVGKTPLDIPYTWYGKRYLTVELKGYTQVRELIALNPPWWQYFPLDFITDVLVPLTIEDRSEFTYRLEKADITQEELREVKKRAAELREKAEKPEKPEAPK
jgi:hypothetical protein